jgi:hypothetical protein
MEAGVNHIIAMTSIITTIIGTYCTTNGPSYHVYKIKCYVSCAHGNNAPWA